MSLILLFLCELFLIKTNTKLSFCEADVCVSVFLSVDLNIVNFAGLQRSSESRNVCEVGCWPYMCCNGFEYAVNLKDQKKKW